MKPNYSKVLPLFILLTIAHLSFSQTTDSSRYIGHFGGAVSVTNNGISLIPTFSLGEPAAIFDLSVGGRKLSFEPQFRFSLDGKPWSFLFWWRYKLLHANKLRVTIGAHPALNFKTTFMAINGDVHDVLVTRRYLAGELAPNYFLTKTISVGMYYLYSHGFDQGATKNTHFLTVNSSLSNIKLSNQFFLRSNPQVYYLKLDEQDGFYVNSTVTLTKRNFPLSLSAIGNKTIHTTITASKDFVWNATLVYSFTKNYARM
ncbi:hypothetical protein [Spirosoma areae]